MMIWNKYQSILRTALVATGSAIVLAANSNAATVYGGSTSVALNATTYNALTADGFMLGIVSPATLSGLTATFPITGGDTTSMIDHSGGLSFTDNGVTADITNFVINLTGSPVVEGTIGLAGTAPLSTSTDFFDIGAGGALTLDSQLAGDLTAVFGAPNLTGVSIGTATINAVTATPEPASISFAALGLLAAGALSRRKRQAAK
jgi:MYXO-CTERM domain-containing protein